MKLKLFFALFALCNTLSLSAAKPVYEKIEVIGSDGIVQTLFVEKQESPEPQKAVLIEKYNPLYCTIGLAAFCGYWGMIGGGISGGTVGGLTGGPGGVVLGGLGGATYFGFSGLVFGGKCGLCCDAVRLAFELTKPK